MTNLAGKRRDVDITGVRAKSTDRSVYDAGVERERLADSDTAADQLRHTGTYDIG